MSRVRHARRGFAAVVAIVLLGLVGATLAVLATSFVGEATRTRTQAAEAQARQLLIAGQMIACADADAVAGSPRNVLLPASLAGEGATLTISGAPEECRIEAHYQTSMSSQVISMMRDSGDWKITGATLNPLP